MITKIVELSYSDKYFAVVSEERNSDDKIRVYSLKDALAWGVRTVKDGEKKEFPAPIHEITAPRDHVVNSLKWGALDKHLYYCTDKGRLIKYSLEDKSPAIVKDVHNNEIFSVDITRDFTMLFTSSRDGLCKLLHPDTFEEVRRFDHQFPVRNSCVSPLYDAEHNQKFHLLVCGG